MSYDHDKQCQDNRIVVDTSSDVVPGRGDTIAWPAMMSNSLTPWHPCLSWPSAHCCSHESWKVSSKCITRLGCFYPIIYEARVPVYTLWRVCTNSAYRTFTGDNVWSSMLGQSLV
jgi:hypothetical protein